MKKAFSWILLSVICISLSLASGDGEEELPPLPEEEETEDSGWVYGRIEYEHDLIAPNLYFLELLAHPESQVPMIEGGYASTDVHVIVRLRGVDTARAMHDPTERHRPHLWRDRERERWNASMKYVWNLLEPTKTLRVHSIAVIEEDKVIEANIEFWLGGAWHNLAISMLQDDVARPMQTDGTTWDPGSKTWGLENPENPR